METFSCETESVGDKARAKILDMFEEEIMFTKRFHRVYIRGTSESGMFLFLRAYFACILVQLDLESLKMTDVHLYAVQCLYLTFFVLLIALFVL